jgi:TatD DNase family protein
MPLIDTHAHLFYKDFKDQLDDILQRAEAAGVESIICVGLDLPTSEQAIILAEKYPQLWATVGVHPHDAVDAPADAMEQLEALASHEKVVAIGETGLDYYRDLSPRRVQQQLFRQHLELARSLDLPVIVHNRRADDDIWNLIQSAEHRKGVLHCYSSGPELARQVIQFGFHISFTGTVTFGKNRNTEVLQAVGLDRVMVETDCPYLAPVPYRGKTNEPAYARLVAEKIAEIQDTTLEEVAKITTANARALFTKMKPPAA